MPGCGSLENVIVGLAAAACAVTQIAVTMTPRNIAGTIQERLDGGADNA
jgi:hypothetical protein